MANLTSARRDALPKSEFGLPDKEAYPVDTKGRAADAKGRATQQLAKGNLSPVEAAKVRHRADVVLGEHDSTYHNC